MTTFSMGHIVKFAHSAYKELDAYNMKNFSTFKTVVASVCHLPFLNSMSNRTNLHKVKSVTPKSSKSVSPISVLKVTYLFTLCGAAVILFSLLLPFFPLHFTSKLFNKCNP